MSITSSACDGLIPSAYTSEKTHREEQREVFASNWIFAGFFSDLSKTNDFLTLSVGGLPVVVQNFDGHLRAFLNVCAHRRATLQNADCGNRKLICPYHGWTYDQTGRPVGIPDNARSFRIEADGSSRHMLRRFCVEACGNFVFVRIASEGKSLRDFLGEQWDVLEHLSTLMLRPVASRKLPWATNWKIGVESVLEIYHVAQVHPETFKKFTQSRWDCHADGPHSTGHSDLSPEAKKWWRRVRGLLSLRKSDTLDEYNHYFIYPNLAIGITNGTLMSVQTYDPVDPEHCTLNYRLWLAGPLVEKTSSIGSSQEHAIVQSVVSFNERVLEEDRLISEQCQRNMSVVEAPAVIGVCEGRIQAFHRELLTQCRYQETP